MAYDQDKTRRTTIDLPIEMYEEIEHLAKKDMRTVAAMIRVLVTRGLEKLVSDPA